MDTSMSSLPAQVGDLLMKHITVIEIVSMFSIGAYNALEVAVSTFSHFTHFRGLYFWSMQVASWGIVLHAIPAQIRYVSQASDLATCIPFIIGWYAMVTGQAVVLYSRLQLVVPDRRPLRWVLWMIVVNVFLLHLPMTVLFFGVNLGDKGFDCAARIFDRIQVTGFCIQDSIICGIYIFESYRALRPVLEARGYEGRKVIIHLMFVNILVMIMNILLLIVEYRAHSLEVSFKIVVYSIKLKLEFAVLTRLRSLTRTYPCVCIQEPGSPRRSSDINVFDMALARSRARLDVEAPSLFVGVDPSQRRCSLRSSTFEFHQALRETTSTENMISPVLSCVLPDSPTEKRGRPRLGSAETTSTTMEVALSESPKR